MRTEFDLAIVGAGAAGFFAAANVARLHPEKSIVILEKSSSILSKVLISGGGRCNVTHHYFDPHELSEYYPRGSRELLPLFHQFGPQQTIEWLKERGVQLKLEADGRMFPISDHSETIADCLYDSAMQKNVELRKNLPLQRIEPTNSGFRINHGGPDELKAKKVLMAGGSSQALWNLAAELGHTIVQPVPSLFTFKIKSELLEGLMGIAFENASVKLVCDKSLLKKLKIKKGDEVQSGPLLITHWGLSGPAVLKLSSIAARLLFELNYQFTVEVNFLSIRDEEVKSRLIQLKMQEKNKKLKNTPLFGLASRFKEKLLEMTGINPDKSWAEISNKEIQSLVDILCSTQLTVNGKTTFKEEFVTAGGIDLKEVNFKTMESKIIPGIYFAGEILNIDALTGGFNFQACWTEAHIFAKSVFAEE